MQNQILDTENKLQVITSQTQTSRVQHEQKESNMKQQDQRKYLVSPKIFRTSPSTSRMCAISKTRRKYKNCNPSPSQ